MVDMERARRSPSTEFDSPEDVVQHAELSRQDKIEILRRWRYDALLLETAQSENLQSDKDSQLRAVMTALQELGVEHDDTDPGATA